MPILLGLKAKVLAKVNKVQWSRIHLLMQGTWARSCRGTKIPHVAGPLST